LSQQLCEQLRVILEPVLATKLRGDYRTGKRINIKKVISYIASQFRRDKIWLRRTKPNKRQYQVMVAIDDSASMSSNGAGRVALEALTVISRALTQLGIGELGVMRFGSDVKLLHAFDKPFSSESGAFVLSSFSFAQQQTDWLKFLQSTVSILETARHSSSMSSSVAVEQLQLVFVISDARVQQDRGLVARWAAEALARKQLLVLIIVDVPPKATTAAAAAKSAAEAKKAAQRHSILHLKSAFYVDGKMRFVPYLENFPLQYYVLLQDIQSLPELIGNALKQWFEMIRGSL
jgi:midasin